ncbi:MAG: hypothetical protein ABI640_06650 [Gammaproteobacteria bacterium]
MSATVRPDNLKAALDAKIAAAMAYLAELREAEQPRVTPHLNSRELVGTLMGYARSVQTIASAFGRAQSGELQHNAWYEQWKKVLSEADRRLWLELGDERGHAQGAALVDVETLVASDPSVAGPPSQPRAHADVRKRVCRFAAFPERPASDVCSDMLLLARRFAGEFLRDHARFLR